MNLKVQYITIEEGYGENRNTGFLQDFVVINNHVHGVLITGKTFITVPIENILIEKTLI